MPPMPAIERSSRMQSTDWNRSSWIASSPEAARDDVVAALAQAVAEQPEVVRIVVDREDRAWARACWPRRAAPSPPTAAARGSARSRSPRSSLLDEPVGAGLERADLGVLVRRRREQQARRRAQARIEAEPADHARPVDVGHHRGDDDRGRARARRELQALGAARRGRGREPRRPERRGELLAEGRVVVDRRARGREPAARRSAGGSARSAAACRTACRRSRSRRSTGRARDPRSPPRTTASAPASDASVWSRRICSSSSTPSPSGSRTSRIASASGCVRSAVRASAIVAHGIARKPAASSASPRSMRTVRLSSTIRMAGIATSFCTA